MTISEHELQEFSRQVCEIWKHVYQISEGVNDLISMSDWSDTTPSQTFTTYHDLALENVYPTSWDEEGNTIVAELRGDWIDGIIAKMIVREQREMEPRLANIPPESVALDAILIAVATSDPVQLFEKAGVSMHHRVLEAARKVQTCNRFEHVNGKSLVLDFINNMAAAEDIRRVRDDLGDFHGPLEGPSRVNAILRKELSLTITALKQSSSLLYAGTAPNATSHEWPRWLVPNEDFTAVDWGEETFTFSEPQALVVKRLAIGLRPGKQAWISQPNLLDAIAEVRTVNSETLRDIFRTGGKDHPAWKAMILPEATPNKKNLFRIATPPSSEKD